LRRRLLTLVSLGLLAGAAFAAGAAGPTRAGSVLGAPIIGVHPSAPPAIAPSFRHTVPRSRVHGARPFTRFAVPVYAAPLTFYGSPEYSELPAVIVPPPDTSVRLVPPPPPERDVIHYSDGRYELRGDGISTPYRWVWIPSPPPPPGSRRDVRLYGWIDEGGVLHVTDRLNTVPERHREQAKRNASS
jgi:hypothetical protein